MATCSHNLAAPHGTDDALFATLLLHAHSAKKRAFDDPIGSMQHGSDGRERTVTCRAGLAIPYDPPPDGQSLAFSPCRPLDLAQPVAISNDGKEMLLGPQPIMPRQSPRFLEVPKALPHRRSRSRPRDLDTPGHRTRSRTRNAPDSPTHGLSFKSTSPTRSSSRKRSNGLSYRKHSRSPPPVRPVRSPPPRRDIQPTCVIPPPKASPEMKEDLNGDFYTLAPSRSPSPEPFVPLRERLVGAWRLESYIAYPTATSPIQRPTFPMTKAVTGLIMYTPDGYMSAQMLIPGQSPFVKGGGDDAQWAEASKRCFAYAGPYYISDEGRGREEILRHTFQICSLPGWVGDVQVRTWKFEEDGKVLVLGSEEPTEIRGDHRIPVLKWRRCMNNCNKAPPPPVPQIKVSGPGEP
ncbi:hypothetical protein K461DRAFT_306724 [Myriangium duriaei CBS 260.36]|uniref:Lipocalin-like domain-containing protein n=1 Tax=Myriangium duriaei CBS 260.36 TaxID=1168546 RepID=A0A9P4MGX4_9PEZI|nr:hypothetical protein K461DRAFT_306724 [Myriangium duriaei CBS 260.36]